METKTRYSSNNAYVGFYSVVHDAKYPGDETPPVPHPSTWFKHLERPSSRRRANSPSHSPHHAAAGGATDRSNNAVHQRQRVAHEANDEDDDDDDDDIEIERERISLKCPLTLLTFENPVKSSKCMHSFERQAIEDMIRASSMTVPAGPNDLQGGGGRNARARRVRATRCPVCSTAMTLNDLEPDMVMLRRVRRAQALALREQEDVELGGRQRQGRSRGRSGGVMIESGSDDGPGDSEGDQDNQAREEEIQDRIRIKRERSRMSSRAPTAVSDDEIADEDEDDDED